MTAKDLKNALLQEAVQGKLVPQIASEGNARDLLEEIKKSHTDLQIPTESAGKKKGDLRSKSQIRVTKKANVLPEITEDEIPFDIPESWCWCRLGEISNKLTDGSHNPPPPKNIGYPVISAMNIKNGKITFENVNRYTDQIGFDKENPRTNISKGDIILGIIGGSIGNIAIYDSNEKVIAQRSIAIINTSISNLYISLLLQSPYIQNELQKSKGTAQGGVYLGTLKSLFIPLPPLAEQKRIVAAIEKFMPLIEEYGKKETVLNELNANISTLTKKAILQEAVQGKLVPQIPSEGNARDLLEEIKSQKAQLIKEGKIKKEKPLPEITEDEIPFDIPENWCWCRLSDFCNLYTGNSINETEKKTKYTNLREGRFYIGTKDVGFDSVINYDNGVRIPFENDNFRIADTNTILMCIEGGSAGRKIAFTNQPVCFGNKLCCFDAYKKESIQFLYYFMQSTLFTDLFKDNMNGIIGGVSVNTLKTMLLPLPPLAEQKRIVAAIEQLLPLCEKLGK